VIANDASDPVVLPDIQLIAAPRVQYIYPDPAHPASSSSPFSVAAPVPGTGQVVIAPNAVLEASGAVAPGEPTTYILAQPQSAPVATQGTYNLTDIQKYYGQAVANEIAYVRLSGGNLATTVGGTPTLSFVQTVADTSTQTINNWTS
jgi:hypothetical protein